MNIRMVLSAGESKAQTLSLPLLRTTLTQISAIVDLVFGVRVVNSALRATNKKDDFNPMIEVL